MWAYSCKTYKKEAICRVEDMFCCHKKVRTPLPVRKDFHPKLDKSQLLEFNERKQFQTLLGMLQWLYTIGRLELDPLLVTLNPFGAAPRQGHLELAIRSLQFNVVWIWSENQKNKNSGLHTKIGNWTTKQQIILVLLMIDVMLHGTTGIWYKARQCVALIIIIRGNKRKLAIASSKLKAKYFHQELLIK